jgi:hypothetical protein
VFFIFFQLESGDFVSPIFKGVSKRHPCVKTWVIRVNGLDRKPAGERGRQPFYRPATKGMIQVRADIYLFETRTGRESEIKS